MHIRVIEGSNWDPITFGARQNPILPQAYTKMGGNIGKTIPKDLKTGPKGPKVTRILDKLPLWVNQMDSLYTLRLLKGPSGVS